MTTLAEFRGIFSAVLKYFGSLLLLGVPHDHQRTGPSKCMSVFYVNVK